jgi:phage baseplate assembly protein W
MSVHMPEQIFLGVGWRFPVQIVTDEDGKNRVALARYAQSVEESIRIILGTTRGERVMRPDFGADLYRLSFSPNNTSTAGLAIFFVEEALTKWEPRIELLDVDAGPDEDDANILLITVDYRILSLNTEHNLVYPFYLGSQ